MKMLFFFIELRLEGEENELCAALRHLCVHI